MRKLKKELKRLIVWGFVVLAAYVLATVAWDMLHLPQIDDLKTKNPKTTALMEQRKKEARSKGQTFSPNQEFVTYGQISPYLKNAVLVAEDAAFFSHQGINYTEIREALKTDWKKKRWARGASTITMQLAKNLYLSTSKSLARKISEAVLARRMDDRLSKTRIFELYLNYIEWEPGLFGCQAASRFYFNCPVSQLTPEQAVRLALIIINPRRYGPFADSRRMATRWKWIADKMLQCGYLSKAEYEPLNF
ncbi:monofunctional biosynthetic peptidoglycan transglycosylase [candidate division TA06 bacterium]|uniref:Monofunctional biosynthetic peptidoglycan transglycosylase n=1 Tax=candidate division TA06 bacterium TaxID=2250710 RepID=A0A933IC28_UNCT6|nr:monofunctional biosynthetic peptidoglycan transglycosylase [candidate division TA06 bacterium]